MGRPLAVAFRFVGGKGGVGKTTYAAALAVARAAAGSRVLLVSTDPAHSLGDVLGTRLGAVPRTVPAVAGRSRSLAAVEIDADGALERWLADRREALAEVVGDATYLDREDVDELLGLDFPGVDELMGLMEVDRMARARPYDEVVVDMAPTGHGLRLVRTPATLRRIARALGVMRAKHRYLARALGGGRARAEGRPEAVIEELAVEGRKLEALLRDSARCRFTWVLLPETMAVEETGDALSSLEAGEMTVDELIVNRLRDAPEEPCRFCQSRFEYEQAIVQRLSSRFAGIRLQVVAESETEPRGPKALSKLFAGRRPYRKRAGPRKRRPPPRDDDDEPGASTPVEAIEALASAETRLLLFAGKGGVGKTTAAATAALVLAAGAGRERVLLLSVDPAHSLSDVLEQPLEDRARSIRGAGGDVVGRELDASRAFEELRDRYRSGIENLFERLHRRSGLDASYDREALRELIELAPPGLDELMGVIGLVDVLVERDGADRFDLAIVDAAPTGHALRLLEMPETALSWSRSMLEILLKYRDLVGLGDAAEHMLELARRLRLLRELLQDGDRSAVVLVARPAELPLEEATALLRRLERAKIAVGATLINAMTVGSCSRCRRAKRRERRLLARYLPELSGGGSTSAPARGRRAILHAPAVHPPPSGVGPIVRWARGWTEWES